MLSLEIEEKISARAAAVRLQVAAAYWLAIARRDRQTDRQTDGHRSVTYTRAFCVQLVQSQATYCISSDSTGPICRGFVVVAAQIHDKLSTCMGLGYN